MSSQKECRRIGREFENEVAELLRADGFTVFQDLYVPYRPGCDRYTQVDIVAVNSSAVLTFECKCMSGELFGNADDKNWMWKSRSGKQQMVGNPIRQHHSHCDALRENLGIPVAGVVVAQNWLCVPPLMDFEHYNTLLRRIPSLVYAQLHSKFDVAKVCAKLTELTGASKELRVKHLLQVNEHKNKGIGPMVRDFKGVDGYCLMVQGEYFYACTDDDGHHWATEKIDDAAIFETEEDAIEMSWELPDAEVCTLALGGIESLRDLPNELDGLTPAEYAYEVGARPW